MPNMSGNDAGMEALLRASRLELGRVYSQLSPEYRQPTAAEEDQLNMVDEVRHFAGYGFSVAEVAIRLGTTKRQVRRILEGAA